MPSNAKSFAVTSAVRVVAVLVEVRVDRRGVEAPRSAARDRRSRRAARIADAPAVTSAAISSGAFVLELGRAVPRRPDVGVRRLDRRRDPRLSNSAPSAAFSSMFVVAELGVRRFGVTARPSSPSSSPLVVVIVAAARGETARQRQHCNTRHDCPSALECSHPHHLVVLRKALCQRTDGRYRRQRWQSRTSSGAGTLAVSLVFCARTS